MTKRGWIRLVGLLLIVTVIIILVWRNSAASVTVDVLFIPITMPGVALFLITFLLGFLGGLLTFAYINRRKRG